MKNFSVSLLLISLLFILSACGNNDVSSTSDQELNENPVDIDFSLFSSENDTFSVIFREWAEQIELETDGRVTFTPYYSGQLTSLFETLDSVKNGTIGGGILSAGAVTGQIADLGILEPEGIFENEEHFKKFYNSSLDTMHDIFNENEVQMTFWTLGSTESLTMSPTKFIIDPKEFEGLKVRTAGKWQAEQMSVVGAVPVTMDPGELYLALQNKTIDATGQTVSLAKAFKLYEVAPKIVSRKATANAIMYVINSDIWNTISDQDQETILKISQESAMNSWETIEKHEAIDLQTMIDEGAEVHKTTEEEKEKVLKEITSILPSITDTMGEKGMKLYDSIEESK